MALQTSGQITMFDIRNEFGQSGEARLQDYYRGGGIVPDSPANSGVPTSGQITVQDFYGAANITLPFLVNTLYAQDTSGTNPSITFNLPSSVEVGDLLILIQAGKDGTNLGPSVLDDSPQFAWDTNIQSETEYTDGNISTNLKYSIQAKTVESGDSSFTFDADGDMDIYAGSIQIWRAHNGLGVNTISEDNTDGTGINAAGLGSSTENSSLAVISCFFRPNSSSVITLTEEPAATTKDSEHDITDSQSIKLWSGYEQSLGTGGTGGRLWNDDVTTYGVMLLQEILI